MKKPRLLYSAKYPKGRIIKKYLPKPPKKKYKPEKIPDVSLVAESRAAARKCGYVYFIECQSVPRAIKIGWTANDPLVRMSHIQACCPFELRLIGFMRGGQSDERSLHSIFSEARISSEWFYSTQEIMDFVIFFSGEDKTKRSHFFEFVDKNEPPLLKKIRHPFIRLERECQYGEQGDPYLQDSQWTACRSNYLREHKILS